MLFNSLQYVLFLPLVVALYFLCPPRWRWGLLLGASYYFYACWRVEYLLLIMSSTLVDWMAALRLHRAKDLRVRRRWVAASLVVNLGLLFTFKYFNFVSTNLQWVMDEINIVGDLPLLDVVLPVGISFYTFQTISYTIDVYRGDAEPEPHLGWFAVYVSFFPQLVAGPIERARRLLPQLRAAVRFDSTMVKSGLLLILWGLFEKVVVADRWSPFVSEVYDNPEGYGRAALLLSSYGVAFQAYGDFAGYSHIAIGSAQIIGINLVSNFERPFLATSLTDFWRRWHVSLMAWLRDYVYVPYRKSRPNRAVYRALGIFYVFLLCGAWHGAAWPMIYWGVVQGLFMAVGVAIRARLPLVAQSLPPLFVTIVGPIVVFHLFVFSLVVFQSASLPAAFTLMHDVVWGGSGDLWYQGINTAQLPAALARRAVSFDFALMIAATFVLMAFDVLQERLHRRDLSVRAQFWLLPRPVRWALLICGLLVVGLVGRWDVPEAFVYFQF